MANTDTDQMVTSLRRLVAKPVIVKRVPASSPFVLTPELQVSDASRPKKVPLLVLTPNLAVDTSAKRDDAPQKAKAWPRLNDTPDLEAARHAARLSLEQRIAELEDAVGAQDAGEWEPDGVEEDMMSPAKRDEAVSESSASVHVLRPVPSGQSAPTRDETVKTTRTFSHPVEVRSSPAPRGHSDRLTEGGQQELVGLDPEQIRQIVTEVLQAELKGDLGRHITHNMRLLIQREVQNALAEYLWD